LDVGDVLIELRDVNLCCRRFSIKQIQSACNARVARIIPGITSNCLNGVSLVALGDFIDKKDRDLVHHLFRSIGTILEVEERDFEVLADLTSSALGYRSSLLSEFAPAASMRGVSLDLTENLIRQTLLGTDLISCVATRCSITEQGMDVIQRHSPVMFSQLFDVTKARHCEIKTIVEEQWKMEP